jgi:hypothetical protein
MDLQAIINNILKLFWWMNWLTQTLKVPKIKKMAGCSGNSG